MNEILPLTDYWALRHSHTQYKTVTHHDNPHVQRGMHKFLISPASRILHVTLVHIIWVSCKRQHVFYVDSNSISIFITTSLQWQYML